MLVFSKDMIVYIIAYNIFVFALYGFDKQKAKHHQNRVSERALLLSSMSFGSLGALLGMYFWRHKTKKPTFIVFNTVMLVIHVFILIYFRNMLY